MNIKNEVYILPLLACSMHLSFHLFGVNNFYSYPIYDKISIFLISIYIFITFFFISQFLYLVLYKFPNKYFIFFNTFVTSAFAFLTITILLSFADINHGFILETTLGDKIQKILYLFVFIFLFIIILLTNKKKTFNFYRFLFYLLIIINILFYFRLYNLEIHRNTDNDYENFTNVHQSVYKKKKVFLIIFDELDYQVLENNLDNFPTIKKFVNTSFYHKNFHSNHNNTLKSIPEILTGTKIPELKFDKGKLVYENQKGKYVYFDNENSIFGDLDQRNLRSDIYGMYHPYCKTFIVQECYDVSNFSIAKSSFLISLQNVFNQFYLPFFGIDTNRIRIKLIHFINKFFKKDKNIQNKKSSELIFQNINFLSELSYYQFKYTRDFIQSSGDFVYIHYTYPHTPAQILPNNEIGDKLNDGYLLNLLLVEKTLKTITSSLDTTKNNQILLIITTDHWLREAYDEKLGNQKIFFASKITGDNYNYSINLKQDLTSVKNLILNFFDNKINNNKDILNYFLKKGPL